MPIAQSVAIANGKGGVAKTTLTSHLAVGAAYSGWRVLAIDVDPQGSLGVDLGYKRNPDINDQGAGLLEAVSLNKPVRPLQGVRPNLDVVPGGARTSETRAIIEARKNRDRDAAMLTLYDVVAPISQDYDLILWDCPASTDVPATAEAAIGASHFLLIPTFRDPASVDGLGDMAAQFFRIAQDINPDLELLGVALINVDRRGIRTRELRQQLTAALGGEAPVFKSVVTSNVHAASHARELGMVATEYEQAAKTRSVATTQSWSRSAERIATDYQELIEEVLARMVEMNSQPADTDAVHS